MAQDGTYPPLDAPKPLAENVWVVDSGPQRVLRQPFPIRMTVLRLADGGLFLHSPTRHTPALAAALTALGPVRHLVAPGTAHWSHVSPWRKAFPEALVWAPPGVADRARAQDVDLGLTRVLGGAAVGAMAPDWDAEVAQTLFSAPGFVEIAFHHHASRSLILTDLIQAMEADRLPLTTRLLARAVGSTTPEGTTPAHLRLLLGRRRDANRAAAQQLLALRPERVIFAHGTFYATDGEARLRRALAWLLD